MAQVCGVVQFAAPSQALSEAFFDTTAVNYFGDVFTDVELMESFLMEPFLGTSAVNYSSDVFTDVVVLESFATLPMTHPLTPDELVSPICRGVLVLKFLVS